MSSPVNTRDPGDGEIPTLASSLDGDSASAGGAGGEEMGAIDSGAGAASSASAGGGEEMGAVDSGAGAGSSAWIERAMARMRTTRAVILM